MSDELKPVNTEKSSDPSGPEPRTVDAEACGEKVCSEAAPDGQALIAPQQEAIAVEPERAASVMSAEIISAISEKLAGLATGLDRLSEHLAHTDERLAAIETTVGDVVERVSLLPGQIRMFGGKIDALTTSISESRLRALLKSVLSVYDLVDQSLRATRAAAVGPDTVGQRNLEVLETQLLQILAMNGIAVIPADGAFDHHNHCAVATVEVGDPALDGRVVEVMRRGFRTEQSVLRYAEVSVGKYTPVEEPVQSAEDGAVQPTCESAEGSSGECAVESPNSSA